MAVFQKLRDSAAAKVALLLFILLLLCLPLGHIEGLIRERADSRDEAAAELAQTHAGPQLLRGPVLLVPVTERWSGDVRDANGNTRFNVPQTLTRTHVVFPERLSVEGALAPQERYRGLFRVMFYRLDSRLTGAFAPFDARSVLPRRPQATLELGTPRLALVVSDVRGIEGLPAIALAGERLAFDAQLGGASGVDAAGRLAGIQAPLAGAALVAWREGRALPFDMDLALVGQTRFGVAPLAGETTAHLRSSWPHPGFGGRFLAAERTVTDAGFDARWRVSSLVSQAPAQFAASLDAQPAGERAAVLLPDEDSFHVDMVQPLDVYAMSLRAAKYGALFIALVLAAAFMFEVFRRLRLHPVQYGLVGASIALFFLLLVALSEKLAFVLAYGLSAGASVALLGLYFSAVLGGLARGWSLAAYVAVLYAALFGLLVSESNALLLGSLLLFGMLALLMLLTRRVDWYRLQGPAGATPQPRPGATAT
ncbi:MAG: cell envelope integrity protein CreD [Burkholderiaceae bacterium]|nr:cell envelope integrity protein CreD [Burkholderiaceae bacterium]